VKQITKLFVPEIAALEAATAGAEKSWQVAFSKYESARTAHDAAYTKLSKTMPPGETPERRLAHLDVRCGQKQREARHKAEELARLALEAARREVASTISSRWEGEKDLLHALEARAAHGEELTALTARGEKIVAAIAIADYCVEAFGDRGIRSLLVDGVSDFVNERVAAHLEVLAAGEATMRMSATTDLKKGGAKERISFKTEWTWGGAGPLDGSGGQDRREDLALFAAMQDLAESRSARPFPIKVFDEPFDALDSRGKELAAAWVRGIARARGTALLVTHSEELASYAEPDATWTVVMRKDGATVEVS
jgi:DNA repair exonuclease SbcCD ATPase subunit